MPLAWYTATADHSAPIAGYTFRSLSVSLMAALAALALGLGAGEPAAKKENPWN